MQFARLETRIHVRGNLGQPSHRFGFNACGFIDVWEQTWNCVSKDILFIDIIFLDCQKRDKFRK